MTSFAAVAPLGVHRQLAERGNLGYYNLLIASEILKDPTGYRAFWNRVEGRVGKIELDGHGDIIMDNGIIELGYPLPMRDLAAAAELVHANILILPDTIDDMRMTVKQARHSIVEWKKVGYPWVQLMGVVQGTTFAECMDCADAHVKAGVDMLAVPRGLTPNLGSRWDLVRALAEEHNLPMHLLGFSENIYDDIHSAAASPLVMGIDAATPVWLGMQNNSIGAPYAPPRTAKFGRRPEWFWQAGLQGEEPLRAIVDNLVRVRAWLAAAYADQASRDRLDPSVVRNVHTGRVEPLDPQVQ